MISRPQVTNRAALSEAGIDEDRILTFGEWCQLNSFSLSTGQRLMRDGKGPKFVRISTRRIGVTIGENRRWQASRLIETAA